MLDGVKLLIAMMLLILLQQVYLRLVEVGINFRKNLLVLTGNFLQLDKVINHLSEPAPAIFKVVWFLAIDVLHKLKDLIAKLQIIKPLHLPSSPYKIFSSSVSIQPVTGSQLSTVLH